MEGPLLRNLPTLTAVLAVVMFVTSGCYALVSMQLILSGIAVNGTIVDTLRWSSIFSEGDEKFEHYPIVKF